jgi:hypothetical protein
MNPEITFAVKNFVFFFDKMHEALLPFQKICANKAGMIVDGHISPEEEETIHNNTRILYLRAIDEYKNIQSLIPVADYDDIHTKLNTLLPDAGMVGIMQTVGQMIIQYEAYISPDFNGFDDLDDYEEF